MGIPYGNHTSCEEGKFKLGISLSKFMKLVDDGLIEVSYRGGKNLLVNDESLNGYITKYGGRKERYREYIRLRTYKVQEEEIRRIYDLMCLGRLKHEIYYAEYEEANIERFYKVLKLKKANQKYLQEFYSIGFTDEMLNNYYGTKKTVKESVGNCSYIFESEKYKIFFLSYKINLQEFKEIKFLKKTKIKEIIIKARELFGY